MYTFDKELVSNLKTLGLPVYYNQFVDDKTPTPCISYEPTSNVSYLEGDNLFYSHIDYYIRVWGHDKEELMPYVEQLADLMRSLGFRRTSYTEMTTDTQICIVVLFKATGFEHY